MERTYKIEVDCANCASKIERAIQKIDNVDSVAISFITQKMVIQAEENYIDAIMEKAIKTAKRIEPDCKIYL